jgi:hypothetical protein
VLDQLKLVAQLLPDGFGQRANSLKAVAHRSTGFRASLTCSSIQDCVYPRMVKESDLYEA